MSLRTSHTTPRPNTRPLIFRSRLHEVLPELPCGGLNGATVRSCGSVGASPEGTSWASHGREPVDVMSIHAGPPQRGDRKCVRRKFVSSLQDSSHIRDATFHGLKPMAGTCRHCVAETHGRPSVNELHLASQGWPIARLSFAPGPFPRVARKDSFGAAKPYEVAAMDVAPASPQHQTDQSTRCVPFSHFPFLRFK